jgi:hypothetical protein
MHLLETEAGHIARGVVGVIGAALQHAPGVDAEAAGRVSAAVRGRLQAENDRTGLEALDLFEQDPGIYRVPLLVVLANKANQDAGYRAHLRELVLAAGGVVA